jgi:hypothetical protein
MRTIALVCGRTAVMTALGSSPASGATLDTPRLARGGQP